jgi:hypothetical protein
MKRRCDIGLHSFIAKIKLGMKMMEFSDEISLSMDAGRHKTGFIR